MDPIIRRSLPLYLAHIMTWSGILGPSLRDRELPAFEIIPLLVPVWLVSSVVFTERDESYGFLRTLPVTDSRIARTKSSLILGAAVLYWLLMVGAAIVRQDASLTGPAPFVYITIVSIYGLVMGTCVQLLFWRLGASIASGAGIAFMVLSMVLTLGHMASLHSSPGWPVLSRTGAVGWLAGVPWLSIPVLGGLALLIFYGLLQAGIRVKVRGEACL